MIKVRLTRGCTVSGIVHTRGTVIEVENYIAEKLEKRGLGEPLISGLILPRSARKKKSKPKKRSTEDKGE
jgi:hypothetical protein